MKMSIVSALALALLISFPAFGGEVDYYPSGQIIDVTVTPGDDPQVEISFRDAQGSIHTLVAHTGKMDKKTQANLDALHTTQGIYFKLALKCRTAPIMFASMAIYELHQKRSCHLEQVHVWSDELKTYIGPTELKAQSAPKTKTKG